jgi:two-component system, NtrC family, sensor histidine kinase HydH
MTYRDSYNLLSSAVRIANAPNRPYSARLKSLAKFLSRTLRLSSLTIYLLDEEYQYLSHKVSTVDSGTLHTCLIPVGEGGAGQCAAVKTVMSRAPEELHVAEPRSGCEAQFFFLPVPAKNRVIGVMALGTKEMHSLPETAGAALRDILNVVAGIIEGILTATASMRQLRNRTILSGLGQLLNRFIPPDDLIPLVLKSCNKQPDSCCTMLRLSGDGGLPAGLFMSCKDRVRPYLDKLLGIEEKCSAGILGQDVSPPASDLISHHESPPTYVCVPLRFESKTLGTVTFFGKKNAGGSWRNFDKEDRVLFENMAMIISNALAGAATLRRISNLSAEIDTQLKELSLLYRVSNTMLSTIKLNKLIHLTLTALTAGASPFFDRAMLFLINERSGIMQGMLGVTRESSSKLITPLAEIEDILSSRWDIAENDMVSQRDSDFSRLVMASRLELNKSLNVASRAVLEKRQIYVPLASREKRVDRDFIRRFGITSFAVAPLIARERVVGVIIVDNALQGKTISRDDLRFLQLFTNQAGMAIENSILYNRLEDANQELYEAQEQLIQGERLATIGEMAAGIAHELKGPLVAVGGFARRLAKNLPQPSSERECADLIVREVQRLEKMLTDILSFSKKTSICYTPCNILEIIKDALAVVQPSLAENHIKVFKNFPKKIDSFFGDCQQLKQVFINLFLNAQEAMKSGGKLRIHAAPSRLDGREAILVKIADTGGGIPLEILANIFNPFYTTKASGTGLGLPIANRIITNHGGKIRVDNLLGTGVEFTVILPLEG